MAVHLLIQLVPSDPQWCRTQGTVLVVSGVAPICLQQEYFNLQTNIWTSPVPTGSNDIVIIMPGSFYIWEFLHWAGYNGDIDCSENRSSIYCVVFCLYYDDDFYSYRHTTYSYDAHNLRIIIGNWCPIISQQKSSLLPAPSPHQLPPSPSPSPHLPWVLEKLNLIAGSLIDLLENFPVPALALLNSLFTNQIKLY